MIHFGRLRAAATTTNTEFTDSKVVKPSDEADSNRVKYAWLPSPLGSQSHHKQVKEAIKSGQMKPRHT